MEPNENNSSDEMSNERETQTQKMNEQQQQKESQEKANFMGKIEMVKYQNFWCRERALNTIQHFQSDFKTRDSDIILASLPKSGTTWLKSLLFSIVNRFNPDHHPLKKNSPLLHHNPHDLVYFLDFGVYGGFSPLPSPQELQHFPSPRLLQTHLPYPSLPESIPSSLCKIVCIARNPFDTLVSLWHWHVKLINNSRMEGDPGIDPPSIEDFFEEFCQGKFPCGPYFEHVLEFWRQSLDNPNKVLFLKYEDLRSCDGVLYLKKLAEFVGYPFSDKEESQGVVNDIMELCSINSLREFEVNKSGYMLNLFENKNYFRKGEVGDWTNYFTPSMVQRLNVLIKQHFDGTGLSFAIN